MIEVFSCGPVSTNTLLIYCSKTKEAAVLDPSMGSSELVEKAIESKGLKPTKILLTHSHWDHIADLNELATKYALQVLVHPEEASNVTHPGSDGLNSPIFIEGFSEVTHINEGDLIEVGTITLKVIETPGHTPGGIVFYIEEKHLLLSGDTLFQGSYGRLDLPTGNAIQMVQSLKKLATLPPDTIVIPGHGPQTILKNEHWIAHPETKIQL